MTAEAQSEYTEVLYVALEMGGTTWKVFSTVSLGRKPRSVSILSGDVVALEQELSKAKQRFHLSESAPVKSCYEAGRDGFFPHRHLVSLGVNNVVIEPASLSVDRRARRAKTDRLDGEKMLRHLIRSQDDPKEWRVVRVPSVAEEDQRHLNRELGDLKKERTALTCRIKSLLVLHNVRMPVSKHFLSHLERLDLEPHLRSRLRRAFERREVALAQIGELRKERRALIQEAKTESARQAAELWRLRGVGETGAWTSANELFGWRQLRNRREVGSLLGLTPTPYHSDGGEHEQGISKAGLSRVRALSIELAWCWLRYQPESQLSRWFQQRFGSGKRSRKVGIVALARKLMIALWRYAEFGILPEGAVLKA